MIGGGGFIVFMLVVLCIPADNIMTRAQLFALFMLLQFVVNYPHFILSYQLLYSNYTTKIRSFKTYSDIWWRYIISGIVAPLLLLVLITYAVYDAVVYTDFTLAGYGVYSMTFFVGWHYVKQSYGVFIVSCALRKQYYSGWQKNILLYNSYFVWFSCFVFIFPYVRKFVQSGFAIAATSNAYIPDMSIHFPAWLAYGVTAIASGSTLAGLYVLFSSKPPFTAIFGYLSMYFLFVFAWVHPVWAFMFPFFHSLQYMLFVGVFKKGNYRKEIATNQNIARTKARYQRFFAYSFLIGILTYFAVPRVLDAYLSQHLHLNLPTNLIETMIIVFTNTHHYFIDNAIWKKDNKDVGEYIFTWSR